MHNAHCTYNSVDIKAWCTVYLCVDLNAEERFRAALDERPQLALLERPLGLQGALQSYDAKVLQSADIRVCLVKGCRIEKGNNTSG